MAVYKYRVEAKKVAPRQGSKLLGTASLNIAGQFKVTGIQIRQGKGGKPFVSMPSYKSNEAGANGKPVYKQLFHAIGADQKQVDAKGKIIKNEVQELLNKNILKAYEKSSEIPGHPGEYEPGRFDYSPEVDLETKLSAVAENKETPLKITARMTAVPERNGMLGYGSIRVGDFQLNSVQYRASAENPSNRYAAMPSYSVLNDGKPAYYNVGYPITEECSAAVREAVQEAFEYSQQHQVSHATETNPFLEESQESSFSNEENAQRAEILQEQTGQETRKYEFTGKTKIIQGENGAVTLHRIRAVTDFGDVKAGQLGGWIESEQNLSQDGEAFVYGEAQVFGEARVEGNAEICGAAQVYDNARVCGHAHVDWHAQVYGDAQLSDNVQIIHNAQVYGNAQLSTVAWVQENAQVYGDAKISGCAEIYGAAQVYDNARVNGEAKVHGNAKVYGNAHVFNSAEVFGNARVHTYSEVCEKSAVFGDAEINGLSRVRGTARIYGDAKLSAEIDIEGDIHMFTECEYEEFHSGYWRNIIRQDIRVNGFKPSNLLVRGIERLDELTGKHNTLRDIKEMAKTPDTLSSFAGTKEALQDIVETLQQQEVKMQAPEPPAVEPA